MWCLFFFFKSIYIYSFYLNFVNESCRPTWCIGSGLVLSQGSQCAAGSAEWGTARVGERTTSDRVVLKGACLAARAEIRVGRRFHCCHAGVVGVQVGVIHLIHGDKPVWSPVFDREVEQWQSCSLCCCSGFCSSCMASKIPVVMMRMRKMICEISHSYTNRWSRH